MKALALLVVCGCGRIDFDALRDAAASDSSDAQAIPLTWGDYAATLPVGPCSGAVLMVNDTTDAIDGGTAITDPSQAGPTLSLVEALWIAVNRAGPDQIVFDPAVFPADAPATIAISDTTSLALPGQHDHICIDGRSRGVIVDWSACTSVLCPPYVRAGSMLVGLTFIGMQTELIVQAGAQVAGCRLNTDGFTDSPSGRPWTLEVDSTSTLGPGNSIAGFSYALRVLDNTGGVIIHDNFIGYDPLTHVVAPTMNAFGIDTFGGPSDVIEISGNVIAVSGSVVNDVNAAMTGVVALHDNAIGVDRAGSPLGPGLAGITHGRGVLRVGPFNDIENVGTAITVGSLGGTVAITQNRITGNGIGIVYAAAPFVPPTITSATTTFITGTCGIGTIEAFADVGNEGATYLGSIGCAAGVFGLMGTFPAGLNATATLTNGTSTSAFSAPMLIQ